MIKAGKRPLLMNSKAGQDHRRCPQNNFSFLNIVSHSITRVREAFAGSRVLTGAIAGQRAALDGHQTVLLFERPPVFREGARAPEMN